MSADAWVQGGIGVAALFVLFKLISLGINTVFDKLIQHFDRTHNKFNESIRKLHEDHRQERDEMRCMHQEDRVRWETQVMTRSEERADRVVAEVRHTIEDAIRQSARR